MRRIKIKNKNKWEIERGLGRGKGAVGRRHIAREGYRTFQVDSPPGTVPVCSPGKSRQRPNQSIITRELSVAYSRARRASYEGGLLTKIRV